ncbi:Uncharacterised protein [Mycobacteroides abscessus subsp. abscessus]|nr:Uncharacterised protein [Mycobacteroides abscessus subsp. abscessus]
MAHYNPVSGRMAKKGKRSRARGMQNGGELAMTNSALRRMALASVLSTGVGGGATTAIPGLSHWPAASVLVVVATFTLLGGIVKKLMHAALIAASLTLVLIVVDAATGGHIRNAVNPETLIAAVVGKA